MANQLPETEGFSRPILNAPNNASPSEPRSKCLIEETPEEHVVRTGICSAPADVARFAVFWLDHGIAGAIDALGASLAFEVAGGVHPGTSGVTHHQPERVKLSRLPSTYRLNSAVEQLKRQLLIRRRVTLVMMSFQTLPLSERLNPFLSCSFSDPPIQSPSLPCRHSSRANTGSALPPGR